MPVTCSHIPSKGGRHVLVCVTGCSEAISSKSPASIFEASLECFFFLFQSETSFNLISEKCDILSILRDHPENRIYQRKIQVGQRVEREMRASAKGVEVGSKKGDSFWKAWSSSQAPGQTETLTPF